MYNYYESIKILFSVLSLGVIYCRLGCRNLALGLLFVILCSRRSGRQLHP
jgi:hypothetical protein